MKTIEFPIYLPEPSPAAKVLSSTRKRWKRWLLRKLMPKEAWEAPAQVLGKVPAGVKIGTVTMAINEIAPGGFSLMSDDPIYLGHSGDSWTERE